MAPSGRLAGGRHPGRGRGVRRGAAGDPGDGTQVPPRTWAWTGAGVLIEAASDSGLRDGDLVMAIGGVPLGADGGWRAPAQRPGDRLVCQVVRGDLVLWLYMLNTQVVYVMGWAGLLAFAMLFPRPWAPLTRHRWLLWVVCAGPVALVVALALAALGGVGLPSGSVASSPARPSSP
jgi:hypothetical protein